MVSLVAAWSWKTTGDVVSPIGMGVPQNPPADYTRTFEINGVMYNLKGIYVSKSENIAKLGLKKLNTAESEREISAELRVGESYVFSEFPVKISVTKIINPFFRRFDIAVVDAEYYEGNGNPGFNFVQGNGLYVKLDNFELKDSTEDINVLFPEGAGKDEDNLLRTAYDISINFDADIEDYFVALFNDGTNFESYIMRATNFLTASGVDRATFQYKDSNGYWTDVKVDAQEGDVVSIGNVEFLVVHINKNQKSVRLNRVSTTSDVLFSDDDLTFDDYIDDYFVASYYHGNYPESYLMRATNFKIESNINKTTFQYKKDGVWIDAKSDAREGDVVSIGMAEFSVGTILKNEKTVKIYARQDTNFYTLFNDENNFVILPPTEDSYSEYEFAIRDQSERILSTYDIEFKVEIRGHGSGGGG